MAEDQEFKEVLLAYFFLLTAERPVDVLFMGSIDARRAAVLAGYAPTLWTRRARLLTPSEEPRIAQAPDHVVGGDKLDLLASSRVLLNVHRDGASGMEWPRVLESIANGCVVVTEHALDHEPLVAGEHFLQAPAENLATIADLLLDDPQRLAAIRVAAYDFVRAELTMQPAARRLIEIATELSSRRVRYADRRLAPVTTLGPAPDPARAQDPAAPALGVVGAGLKRLAVEMLELRRGAQPRSGRPFPLVGHRAAHPRQQENEQECTGEGTDVEEERHFLGVGETDRQALGRGGTGHLA